MKLEDVKNKIDASTYLALPLHRWNELLSKECQVYVCDGGYIGKCFNEINYHFCSVDEAKEIVTDNLYALLRFKYFPTQTDEVMDRISKIVSAFTANLKSTLINVSFDLSSPFIHVNYIPDYCIAFQNGVYNFKDNCWLFKYDIVEMKSIGNRIYSYDTNYMIMWYMNYDFEPLPINIMDISYNDFVNIMKELCETSRNYCFELCYNIAHDNESKFSILRFQHLCEILGYTCLQSFSQYFVMLIGSGQNGKNSLFDGCFTNRLVPKPAANDLDSIETDRFITGSLENKAHNIFLETSAKTYKESRMLKALTGSMNQTIESKGVSKYSGIINCKYIFAGNDQDSIKFSDNTVGFRRRINIFEIFYRWDSKKDFLKQGDFYDTTFSNSLKELKDDITNNTLFIYMAMMGICSGTNKFSENFAFTFNGWKKHYSDVDDELKNKLLNMSCFDILNHLTYPKDEISYTALFDMNYKRIYSSYKSFDDMIVAFKDPDTCMEYFNEHDIFVSVRFLYRIFNAADETLNSFSAKLKKIVDDFPFMYRNRPYVKLRITASKTYIIK